MEKKNFTILKNWASLTRTLRLFLFISLCSTIGTMQAQDIVMRFVPMDSTFTADTLTTCGGTVTSDDVRFTDDGGNDGNYSDDHERRDTVEICPQDQWHRVKVVFTEFDVARGDTLFAFQGSRSAFDKANLAAAIAAGFLAANATIADLQTLSPTQLQTLLNGLSGVRAGSLDTGSGSGIIGAASARSVSDAFGGWIDANCDPGVNASGCLTFLFKTNGDRAKGTGWDAWVDCEARDITLSDVTIPDVKLRCTEGMATPTSGVVTIAAPTVMGCDTATIADSVFLRVYNQYGMLCISQMLSKEGLGGFSDAIAARFAIGQYLAVFKLKADTTKILSVPFSVQAPSLVANDEINVPFGAACMALLKPDDILEQPCDTGRYMQYNITITIGEGKQEVVLRTTGHDTLAGPVNYPILTGDTIKAAGVSICGGTARVKIERIFYGDRDKNDAPDIPNNILCDNGTQSLYAETIVRFRDESKPWIDIQAAPDTLIACDTTGLAALIEAKGIDNCDAEVPVTFEVVLEEDDPCFAGLGSRDTTLATVTFSATDDCGNIGTAVKQITLIRPDIHNPLFVAKTENITLECTDNTIDLPFPGLKIGIWKNNIFEVRDTLALNTTTYVCGYILNREEENIPSTDCGSKKYFYWNALDWCEPNKGPIRIDTTFIEYTDTTAPVFVIGEGLPIDITLDHFSCTSDIYKVAKPKATDNCDDTPTVRLDMVFRIENGERWPIDATDWAQLDCDSFELKWIASDDCHEQLKNDTLFQIVVIKDVTLPSAHCIDELNVSLPDEWGARIYAIDIDAGSYDACGIKSSLIRIKGTDTPFAEYVNIGCEYVHSNLQIELQVTDTKDKVNICWIDVEVEDKINPYCKPLEDITGDCEEYHNGDLGLSTDIDEDFEMEAVEYVILEGDLLAFYNAKFGDPVTLKACEDNLNGTNCGQITYEQQYQLIEWPCREARIKRRYRAIDWSGNKSAWAVQNIAIIAKQDWKITFPADWEGECGATAPAENVALLNGACDLLAYEVTEKQFDIPGDACFKIERTYHIINWCKYVAGDDPIEIARVEGEHGIVSDTRMITSEGNEDKGYWTYVQILRVHDNEAPVVTVINPESCINGVDFDAEPYGEEDITPGAGPFECDELKTWSATVLDCSVSITWTGKLYNVATGEVVAESETNKITYVVSNKEAYFAEFWAFDNCGNSAGAAGDTISFWDCKKPTPYVLNGMAIELMETGMVQVWATDLNLNSFDNCTDQSKLDYRIWADFLGDAPTSYQEVLNLGKVITFSCERVGTNAVRFYVIDEERNWDFAETYVIVQDNMFACGGPNLEGMIAGKIVTPKGENVEAVEVMVNGATQTSMTTSVDGQFQFNMETGADYTITPIKDINPLNGVSTFDLVLISKHILGINTFDSPYKYIAADVNQSGSITAFDLVQLRQLILNITTEFSNNDSWRFVDANYTFATTNPASEQFNEFYTVTALNGPMENMNFVGVKIGDVNGNAQANNLLNGESRTTNETLTLTAKDRFVEVGEKVTVAFSAAEIVNTLGYQFTLNIAGQNPEIIEGVAKTLNFNTNLAERGIITTSWNGEATPNEELFGITFQATTAGLLSEMIAVSSDITRAEAYNTAGELMEVNINFTTASVGFELAQNTPNPFKEETVIGFNLPVAGMATITVMDIQGKVVTSIQGEYAKGANQVTLKAGELGATGILYYQLFAADNVITKKMIVLE